MRKGFTLIELLAVIIILAILMIIAVPNILSTLATAREQAFLSQAKSIYKTAQQQFMLDSMMGNSSSCYDKSNLNMGSISDTVSFVVSVDEEDGSINNIEIIDTGQGLKASGSDINRISLKTYTEATISCSGYSTPYTETLLHGADPVLAGDLIPVTLSSANNNWTVTYADTTQQWYKYGESKWANAVRLVSNPSKTYAVGDTIEHSDISAYFVWIPRYKYKLFDMGNYSSTVSSVTAKNQLIDIVFGTDTTTDTSTSCATPMTSGSSGNCAVNKYMTHPAFLSFNSNGFWVGKFETAGTTSNNTTMISSINILPGVMPLTGIKNYDIFTAAYNYNRALDSHMMKNTEWGALAYLAHSAYGMGNKNIYINNYLNGSTYKTGCVAGGPNNSGSTECVNQWYSSIGVNGSTTGNITGIYDMSGGVWESTASYVEGAYGESGYTAENISIYQSKYFDVYLENSLETSWNNRILGDATGEFGAFVTSETYLKNSWYDDFGRFIYSSNPCFARGGRAISVNYAGLFSATYSNGFNIADVGFRLVLAP